MYTGRTPCVHRCGAAWIMAALVLISGCAAKVVAPVVDLPLRNPASVLAGTTRFEADRFAGDWVTRACIGACPASVSYGVAQTGGIIATDEQGSRAYAVTGPGILRAVAGTDVLVVMWVDEGFRTAAIGDSAGKGAAILDRAPSGGADRIAAAIEILDFNGWDTGQLRKVK